MLTTHAAAIPLPTGLNSMLGWLSVVAVKPAVVYPVLGLLFAPVALAVPDAATVLTLAGVFGPALGILYGTFWVASRTRIAPVEREIDAKRAEFDREQEAMRVAFEREMAIKRAQDAAAARMVLADAEAAAVKLLDEARKGSLVAELDDARVLIAENTARLARMEADMAEMEVHKRRLDAEILEFAQMVLRFHQHSGGPPP